MKFTDPQQLRDGDHALALNSGEDYMRYELRDIRFLDGIPRADYRAWHGNDRSWGPWIERGEFGAYWCEYERRPKFEDLVGTKLRVVDGEEFGLNNTVYDVFEQIGTGTVSTCMMRYASSDDSTTFFLNRAWWEDNPDKIQLHEEASVPNTTNDDNEAVYVPRAEYDVLMADYHRLIEAFHAKATERGLCSEYDEVVEEIDEHQTNKIPPRFTQRTYAVAFRIVLDGVVEDPGITAMIRGLGDLTGVVSVDDPTWDILG